MTWLAFSVGAFLGCAFTLFVLSVIYVCSRDARHEARVAKYVAEEQANRA